MIKTKEELRYYMKQDALAMRRQGNPNLLGDEIYKFIVYMRKLEYFTNARHDPIGKILQSYYKLKYHKLSVLLGFSIPINTFQEGLSIVHQGYVVVSQYAKVGKNCRLQTGVVIGATSGEKKAPRIGNNVYIGAGAKIIGDIVVADDIAIGANAVVVKSILESGITVGGIPAKKISDHNSRKHLSELIFEEE